MTRTPLHPGPNQRASGRRLRTRALVTSLLIATTWSWAAFAQGTAPPSESDQSEPSDDTESRGRRVRDPNRFRSPQRWAVELRLGAYRPDIDSEFGGARTPFQDIFGTGPTVSVGFEGDWQALRIPHFGSLGPGIGIGYLSFSAPALLEADPSQRSAQPTTLWMLPLYAVGVLRLDVLSRDLSIPIVPYAKVGVGLTFWEGLDGGRTGEANGVSAQGAEIGYQGMLGAMLLLDFFAPQAAIDMDNATGVNHAYLFFEWLLSDISTFQTGLNTGTSSWQAGLALEF